METVCGYDGCNRTVSKIVKDEFSKNIPVYCRYVADLAIKDGCRVEKIGHLLMIAGVQFFKVVPDSKRKLQANY